MRLLTHSRFVAVYLLIGLFMVLMLGNAAVSAHEDKGDVEVVPEREYETAKKLGLEGPAETRGISSVKKLGQLDLAEEFPPMEGRRFRAREITIEPGGVVAVHRHQSRPGFAYILEGEIIEHRNDHPDPILRKAGDVAIEKTGVSHWWENRSDGIVRALVVDIVETEAE